MVGNVGDPGCYLVTGQSAHPQGVGCPRCGKFVNGQWVPVRRVLAGGEASSAFAAFENSRIMLSDDPAVFPRPYADDDSD